MAVVVTFNRLRLLRRTVECLRLSRPAPRILVVNNGSSDGTAEWLAAQPDITLINQDNVGGSGGYFSGIRRAYQMGAEWIWCMDDDVFPRPDCLESLLRCADAPSVGILSPRRLLEGKVYAQEFLGYNLRNPFASMYVGRLSRMDVSEPIEIKGAAFEGPLIRREVVEAVGLPNKDLFIFCDDTDFSLRTVLKGFRILYVPAALIDKYKFFSQDTWSQRSLKKKWKRFYQVRNSAYLNHHYGQNWAVRHLRSLLNVVGYMATALATCPFTKAYSLSDIPRFWRAYRDGVRERLGRIAD